MSILIYEDDQLEAFWLQGTSSFVVISFDDLISISNKTEFGLEKPALKLSITCLGIKAKYPNWYPRKNIILLWEAVSSRLEAYNERILYGCSMGGHAAIKFSALMQASTTISLCPQWSINPNICKEINLGWSNFYNDATMGDMCIKLEDLGPRTFILSDPYNETDQFHCQKILNISDSVSHIQTYYCEHNVAPVLAGTFNFSKILNFCRLDQVDQLAVFVSRIRRTHYFRKKALIERGIREKPSLTFDIAFRNATSDEHISDIIFKSNGRFSIVADEKLTQEEREKYFSSLINMERNFYKKFRMSIFLENSMRYTMGLFTEFGTRIYYSPYNDEIVHCEESKKNRSFIPVSVRLLDNKMELFIEGQYFRETIPMNRNTGIGKTQEYFSLIVNEDSRFSLCLNGKFLSADPRGFISCDRDISSNWEYFHVLITKK